MSERRNLIELPGLRSTTAGIVASRVLGLARDMATASLFGLAAGGVLDALVVAFRVPNLLRRLLGEGALTASYLPVLSRQIAKRPSEAGQLAGGLLASLSVVLITLLVVAEILCGIAFWQWGDQPDSRLVLGLTAVTLPYLLFICLAAQASVTLQAWGKFRLPAFTSAILNIVWLLAVWTVVPWASNDKQVQVYVLAICILLAGVLQFAWQVPAMIRLGVRLPQDWRGQWAPLGEIAAGTFPLLLGAGVTQLNTFCDSLIAWGLSASPGGPQTIAWLGGVEYPLQAGAAAAVYYGERLYQFPLGVLGVAVSTAVFPLLTTHAARGDLHLIARDLGAGLRLVLYLGIPASVGLYLLAEQIARLLLERGSFSSGDAQRTARMIAAYATGVWAYCSLSVLVRGFYAVGDRVTPVRVGAVNVAVNLVLNLILIWPWAEAGLAIATSLSACLQTVVLTVIFSVRQARLDWRGLARTAGRAIFAAGAMTIAVKVTLGWMPTGADWQSQLLRVALPTLAGAGSYLAVQRLLLDNVLHRRPTGDHRQNVLLIGNLHIE